MFRPGDAPGEVFTGHEPALPVPGVAVAVVGGLAEHRHRAGGLAPAQHPVVRDVGEQQEPAVAEPHRAFQPAAAGPQPLHDLMADDQRTEPLVDNLDGRIREPDHRTIGIPRIVDLHVPPT
jgi:hypothetical protein